jgi:hypothetical protein
MLLEFAQLLERNSVAEMEVRGRRVHPQFDSQRASFGQFRRKFTGGDNFDRIAAYFCNKFDFNPLLIGAFREASTLLVSIPSSSGNSVVFILLKGQGHWRGASI